MKLKLRNIMKINFLKLQKATFCIKSSAEEQLVVKIILAHLGR